MQSHDENCVVLLGSSILLCVDFLIRDELICPLFTPLCRCTPLCFRLRLVAWLMLVVMLERSSSSLLYFVHLCSFYRFLDDKVHTLPRGIGCVE